MVVACRICGTVHHDVCWDAHRGCGSYACSPPRRDPGEAPADRLVITSEELQRVAPLRPRQAPGAFSPVSRMGPDARPKVSRLAIASLITAVAGIPLVGVVTGLVAILLACLALGRIQARMCRGVGLALGGLLLGLVDVVGWTVFLVYALTGPAAVILPAGAEPDLSSADVTPKIFRAMRANVLIERTVGWRGKAIGSGVILEISDGTALMVTNRHVVDPNFPSQTAQPDLDALNSGSLSVRVLNGPSRPGRVTWVAPDGIDLAMVRAAVKPDEAEAARWMPGRALRVGEPVFAIGNPQNLNWTHTQGVISQFRTLNIEGRSIRVIQTQTAINPGNSGGGLYDDEAYLVGINTWTSDKRASEGLSFAITFESLLALEPAGLTIPAGHDPPPDEGKTP